MTLFNVRKMYFQHLDFLSSQQHTYWLCTCHSCITQVWCLSGNLVKDNALLHNWMSCRHWTKYILLRFLFMVN